MFRRSKKKVPQSSLGNYVGSMGDCTTKQHLYNSSLLQKYNFDSESGNSEGLSVGSVNSNGTDTSDDASYGSNAKKSKSLTFSSFLGTPKLSRKEVSRSTESINQGREDAAPAKKPSMMSRVKQVLGTPRMKRKEMKNTLDTSTISLSKDKPPPLPRRVSSLTRNDEQKGKPKRNKHQDRISSESKYIVSPDHMADHRPHASVDVDTIAITLRKKSGRKVEKCETMYAVDYHSDEETSESLSSSTRSFRAESPTLEPPSTASSSGRSCPGETEQDVTKDLARSKHSLVTSIQSKQTVLNRHGHHGTEMSRDSHSPDLEANEADGSSKRSENISQADSDDDSQKTCNECESLIHDDLDIAVRVTCDKNTRVPCVKEAKTRQPQQCLVECLPVAPPRRKRPPKVPAKSQEPSKEATDDCDDKAYCDTGIQRGPGRGSLSKSKSCDSVKAFEGGQSQVAKMKKQQSEVSVGIHGDPKPLPTKPPVVPKPQWLTERKEKPVRKKLNIRSRSASLSQESTSIPSPLACAEGSSSLPQIQQLETKDSYEVWNELVSVSDTKNGKNADLNSPRETYSKHTESSYSPQTLNVSATEAAPSGSSRQVGPKGNRASTPTMELYQNTGGISNTICSVPNPQARLDTHQNIIFMDDDGYTSSVHSPQSMTKSTGDGGGESSSSNHRFTESQSRSDTSCWTLQKADISQQLNDPSTHVDLTDKTSAQGQRQALSRSVHFEDDFLKQQLPLLAGSNDSLVVQETQQLLDRAQCVNHDDTVYKHHQRQQQLLQMPHLQQLDQEVNVLFQESTYRSTFYVAQPLGNAVPHASLRQPQLMQQVLGPTATSDLRQSQTVHKARQHHPLPHSLDTDLDIDITSEIFSPRSKTKSLDAMMCTSWRRASTPTIEQIRNLQSDQYNQNDIVVDTLRNRPSTPLIGEHGQIKRHVTLDTDKSLTPILGVPFGDTDGNPEAIVMLGEGALPSRSNQMELYNDLSENAGKGALRGTGNSRRLPSPDLRAKVNSVLDSFISRPFVAKPDRQSTQGTPAIQGLLQDTNIEASNDAGRTGRPAIDLEALNNTSSCVPPLNLDFTTAGASSDQDNSVLSSRAPKDKMETFDLGVVPLENVSSFPSERSPFKKNTSVDAFRETHEEQPGSNYDEDSMQQAFPGYKNPQESHQGPSPSPSPSKGQQLLTEEAIAPEYDYTPDVSNACLELSNQDSLSMMTSGDEEELPDDDTDRDASSDSSQRRRVYVWESKVTETWTSRDVREWCVFKGFHQVAEVLDEKEVTGEQLINLEEVELQKAGIHEQAARREFMEELHQLKLRPRSAASLWRLKQTSMKRQTLEASSDLIKDRLYNLQAFNLQQQHLLDTSMEELMQQQRETDEILGVDQHAAPLDKPASTSTESLSDSSHLHRAKYYSHTPNTDDITVTEVTSPHDLFQLKVPLIQWSREDVLTWLRTSNLERFTPTFQKHGITGQDLAGISMQLLDELNISSTEDREILLSQLYDLQHPQPPALEDTVTSHQTANQHPASPKDSMDVHTQCQVVTDGCSPVGPGTPNRNTSFHDKLREIISPWRLHGRHRGSETIHIYHDFTGTARCSEVTISESTTSLEVVQIVLERLEITDDANLYYLSDACPPSAVTEKGLTRELGRFECPLALQRQWTTGSCQRFELNRKLGITIKVICQVSNIKPRGKVFRVSPQTDCGDALRVALRKFGMSHVDPALFCLLPVHKESGDVRMMEDEEIIQDCETDAFVLSNHSNSDQLLNHADTLPLLQHKSMVLRRNSSLNSHGSSALSQSSETSLGSDISKPRFEKLESLEAQMADIEASLAAGLEDDEITERGTTPPSGGDSVNHGRPPSGHQPNYSRRSICDGMSSVGTGSKTRRYVTPRKQKLPSSDQFGTSDVQSDDQLELLREIALMRESVQERDSTILTLQKENQKLELQTEQIKELQAKLVEVTSQQKEQELHWRQRLEEAVSAGVGVGAGTEREEDSDSGHETNRSSQDSTKDLSKQIGHLEKNLWTTQAEVRTQEDELARLRSRHQVAAQEARSGNRNEARMQSLVSDCSGAEVKLLTLKQKHADIYAQLELTRREHNKQQVRTGPCLYETLSGGVPQCVLCVELACTDGPGFMCGRDGQERLVVKHVAQGLSLHKGDRLLEVDGRRVFHLTDQDLHQILKQAQIPIKMVVLRDMPNHTSQSPGLIEDLNAMKEDLALAMLEIESVQQENQDLIKDVTELRSKVSEEKRKQKGENDGVHKMREGSEDPTSELCERPRDPKQNGLDLAKIKVTQEHATNESQIFSRLESRTARKKLRFGGDVQIESTEQDCGSVPNGIHDNRLNGNVIAYDLLDESVPLWENLRSASKKEVLQVLKDHVLETEQQKVYLDRLLSVVVDKAPHLLGPVDEAVGLQETVCWKPHSEEFC